MAGRPIELFWDRDTNVVDIHINLESPNVLNLIAYAEHIQATFGGQFEPWRRYSSDRASGDRAGRRLVFNEVVSRMNAVSFHKGAVSSGGRLLKRSIAFLDRTDRGRMLAAARLTDIMALVPSA